jgi:glycerol-3-phosphate dehydrogenase (NAD(P)+)
MKTLAIIGGGSWGTALAIVLAPRFETLRLWVFEADLAARMGATRQNDVFLPGFQLPANVSVTSDLCETVTGAGQPAGIVLGVMPSRHARRLYTTIRPWLHPAAILVSATKGLEKGSLRRMSQVIAEAAGESASGRVAVLSGPTFAREIAQGEPAAVVIAAENPEVARTVQQAFSGPRFRLYTNSDPVGVELGAALKNVIAIGAGVCQGLGLGSNTMAALITRGLAEIARLAVAAGGRPETLAGLAGLGDLVLTCTGDLSRNRKVGIELAGGKNLADITTSMRMIAEGVETCQAAVEMGETLHVDLPIIQEMYAVMYQGKSPRESVRDLMERALKSE